MPIYEYECEKCGGVFELIHAVSASPPKNCETPGCKGTPRRMVSAGGFILKGDGWYVNDYPSESRKKGWESESGQGKTAAASESKPESAPAGNATPAATPKAEPKPIAKANSKNPYTGGKSKPSKGKKASK